MLKILPKSIHYLLTIFLFIAYSLPTIAATSKDEKWYEVEVIIFTNHNDAIQDVENWPDKPGSPDTRKVLELFSPGELLVNNVENLPNYYIEPLEKGKNNLDYIEKRINKSRDYTLIVHRTWHQTASRKKKVDPVYLDDYLSENLYQPLGNEEDADEEIGEITAEQSLLQALLEEENTFSQPSTETQTIHPFDPIIPFDENIFPKSIKVPLSPMGPPNQALHGIFSLFKNRFLHVAIDFLYRTEPKKVDIEIPLQENEMPIAMETQEENQETIFDEEFSNINEATFAALNVQEKPPSIGYRHKASKRIRLKEVHYFDHPVFGVIVRVIRYVEPEPDIENAEQISRR